MMGCVGVLVIAPVLLLTVGRGEYMFFTCICLFFESEAAILL